jgi:hypothetical protein
MRRLSAFLPLTGSALTGLELSRVEEAQRLRDGDDLAS